MGTSAAAYLDALAEEGDLDLVETYSEHAYGQHAVDGVDSWIPSVSLRIQHVQTQAPFP